MFGIKSCHWLGHCCVDVCDVELMKACCLTLVKIYFQTVQPSLKIICLCLI